MLRYTDEGYVVPWIGIISPDTSVDDAYEILASPKVDYPTRIAAFMEIVRSADDDIFWKSFEKVFESGVPELRHFVYIAIVSSNLSIAEEWSDERKRAAAHLISQETVSPIDGMALHARIHLGDITVVDDIRSLKANATGVRRDNMDRLEQMCRVRFGDGVAGE
jgi:hypothetical protein